MILGKTFVPHNCTMFLFGLKPLQPVHASVRSTSTRTIHLPVILEQAIVDLLNPRWTTWFLLSHTSYRSIQTDTRGSFNRQNMSASHAYDPGLIRCGFDVHTSDQIHSFDILFALLFDCHRTKFILNEIFWSLPSRWTPCTHRQFIQPVLSHISYLVRGDSFACQLLVDRIVTKFIGVVNKIRQLIIHLTDQQIL
jgi:hypothetical protein